MYQIDRQPTTTGQLPALVADFIAEFGALERRVTALEETALRQRTVLMKRAEGPTPALLSLGDAAQLLGVSRSSLYRMIREGELTRVHVGRSARLTRVSVEAYLAKIRTNGADPDEAL